MDQEKEHTVQKVGSVAISKRAGYGGAKWEPCSHMVASMTVIRASDSLQHWNTRETGAMFYTLFRFSHTNELTYQEMKRREWRGALPQPNKKKRTGHQQMKGHRVCSHLPNSPERRSWRCGTVSTRSIYHSRQVKGNVHAA